VESFPDDGYPPLPGAAPEPAVAARNIHCDVVVIGQGAAGRAAAAAARQAGKQVITLDAGAGAEVIGIYAGPLVVARTAAGMLHAHPQGEIIVATGAAEIQPVAPGNDLAGILTARAAEAVAASGINLGHIVAIGTAPAGLKVEQAEGDLVRFEGTQRVAGVVMRDRKGGERRYACDTAVVGLGLQPRDALLRMGQGLAVRAVGDAARASDIPACPLAGTVCPCSGVTVADLESVWQRGFHELELVKRSTLAGTGTCQGMACMPHVRSFLQTRGGTLQPQFTARPVTRQLTMGEASAGSHHQAVPRTALDGEHRRLGARMDRIGGWWRPWNYGNPLQEYWAVREAVSIGDVSTLGKMQVSGPDALELLERLYPTRVKSIAPGAMRYVLMLNDRGYIFDDGLIGCDGANRYSLTFTSGGASFAEMWVRDWAESWKLDVRILNQTMALGAINVTGPLATELLQRAGLASAPKYMQQAKALVAGVQCRVQRLSFTGELSYELHHPAENSVSLWRQLLELGKDLGIRPHGLQTLLQLRLEKGHIIVGQDTDFDSTARRVDMEWAVKVEKPDFVGRQAVLRTNKVALDRQLAGFEMEGAAPVEGASIHFGSEYAGYVTSSFTSPVLGRAVMLGWLRLFAGKLPDAVMIDGRRAQRVPVPFYDKDGSRARV
jgi:glycine cleavage system aminomethyltransferase T